MSSQENGKFWQAFIMQIDYALILCAGLGTRMGEIGKILPKALWPILNKTLLELQIKYCRELGIKKIYLNAHYLAEELERFIKSGHDDVVILHEEILLGSGGAIHNMAQSPEVNYRGNVLVVNSDQFLFYKKDTFNEACRLIERYSVVLFGIHVEKGEHYNETVLAENLLIDIRPGNELADYVTFSGLSLVNLAKLNPTKGYSHYFKSVADYHQKNVYMIVDHVDYWDFGTATLYHQKMQMLFKEKDSTTNEFILFCKRNQVSLDLIENYVDIEKRAVDLDGQKKFTNQSLHYQTIIQKC